MRVGICTTAIFLCCSLIFLPCVSALSVGDADTDEQVNSSVVLKKGLTHFYNGEHDEAELEFSNYIKLKPDDPVGYWRQAYNRFFILRKEQKTDTPELEKEDYKEFLDFIAKGIEKADVKISKDDNIGFYLYVKACLYSIRAGLEYKGASRWTALGTFKEAIKLAEKSGSQNAKYYIGLAEYNGGADAKRRIVFYLSGLPNNRDKGIRLIFQSVAKNDSPFVDDIWLMIFKIETDDRNEKNYSEEAKDKLFAYLFAKYPRNELMQKYLKEKDKKD